MQFAGNGLVQGVAMRFEIEKEFGVRASASELLADLRAAAAANGSERLTQKDYRERGRFSETTIIKRFGTWNNGLIEAGLIVSVRNNLSDEILFENILKLWLHYGHQPRRAYLALPPSTVSQSPYNRKYGSWNAALKSFVEYANAQEFDRPYEGQGLSGKTRGGRDPSLRLRYKVLVSDSFKCRVCGRSPSSNSSVQLHVDHIVPWSVGGLTEFENLQTLCSICNLGKSNLTEIDFG